jgi:hypothetical protein
VNSSKSLHKISHSFLLAEFRNRSRVILIATDVAARGLGRLFSLISIMKQVQFTISISILVAGASYGRGVPAYTIAVRQRDKIY